MATSSSAGFAGVGAPVEAAGVPAVCALATDAATTTAQQKSAAVRCLIGDEERFMAFPFRNWNVSVFESKKTE
jgi:hypothetical protein